jgi:hypothetical protein
MHEHGPGGPLFLAERISERPDAVKG